MSDLIDIYLVCAQKGKEGEDIAEFLIDFFPQDMTDDDFKNYWRDYDILM